MKSDLFLNILKLIFFKVHMFFCITKRDKVKSHFYVIIIDLNFKALGLDIIYESLTTRNIKLF